MIHYNLSPTQLEGKAIELIKMFDEERLVKTKPIDVYAVIEKCLGVEYTWKYLSPDQSILGMTAFKPGYIWVWPEPYYEEGMLPSQYPLSEGMIVIDSTLTEPGNEPRENFTVMHEVFHQFMQKRCFLRGNPDYSHWTTREALNYDGRRKMNSLEICEYQANYCAAAFLMPKFYLGHLTDVIMIDSHIIAAERLGGADYDGDMVKTIADPLLNQCVMRNYEFESISNSNNIPLLVIPAAAPQIRDAGDWQARYETVKNTFSSRVGHISNAALDRSIIAYDENSTAQQRQRYREEVEMLAILTGLEIDSAKSGIKPDLSEYLDKPAVSRSSFLKYKRIMEDAEKRGAWYEPTHQERVEEYFSKVDWSKVSSNVERLP